MHTMTRAGLGVALAIGLAPTVLTHAQTSDCSGQPNGTACTDGNPCTSGEQCWSEVCVVPTGFVQPAGSPIGVVPYPLSVEVGDFNRDGKPDLVVMDYTSHEFTVLLGNGAGGFAEPPGSPVPTIEEREQTLTTADFNLDGNLDVAVVHADPGLVSVYLGNGAGGFTSAGPGVSVGSGPGLIAAGDFNRDGKPDLVVADGGPRQLRILLGNGAGGFTEASGSPVSAGNGPGLAVGDFNLDGKLDLAEADINDKVLVLLGDGGGGFARAPDVMNVSAGRTLAVGDFNLDGKPDLVAAYQLYITVLIGDGHGGFVPHIVLTAPFVNNGVGDFEVVSVGDFNVDHKPDIAVLNYWTETFSILLGNGSGGFVELADPGFGPVSSPLAAPVADFNLDGKDDLAIANFFQSSLGIFLNNHAGSDGAACDDGNPCTVNDSCSGGACVSGAPRSCDDGNACNGVEACDPASGCVAGTPVACAPPDACHQAGVCQPSSGTCAYASQPDGTGCDDGNACTVSDSCSGGACHGGAPRSCDDGNACNGAEACDPATGCVAGTPVTCAPPDACHQAGVCQPGSGTCAYANQPDGTACDDGNPVTRNDACTGGVCTGETCGTNPTPKTSGYYKSLCRNGQGHPFHGDALTDADALCAGEITAAFAGFSTVPDLCAIFDQPGSEDCSKAETELLSLAINICRGYVCESQEVDSSCSGHDNPGDHTLTTVAASLSTADAIVSDPGHTRDTCQDARCLAREINDGKGLHQISLTVATEPGSGDRLRLSWDNPVMDDGSGAGTSYTIWRRPLRADAAFTQIAQTPSLTYVDAPPGSESWEYGITFTVEGTLPFFP